MYTDETKGPDSKKTDTTKSQLTLDALLIWGDGGALDAHAVLLDGLSRVDGHLVVSRITVREPQVVVQTVYVQVGEDELKTYNHTVM